MRPETKALYTKDWPKISKALIKKVGHCVACTRTGSRFNPLTVHHMDYNPANNLSSNLEVLCAACHLRIQNRERRYGRMTKHQLVLFPS